MANSDQSLYNLRFNQVTNELEGFGGGVYIPVTITNTDPTQVPVTRLINTTAPLTGGGNLSMDRTLSMPAATGSVNGYLLSADWITFNNKQPAGSYITALTGDVTASGPGSVVATIQPLTHDLNINGHSVTNAVEVQASSDVRTPLVQSPSGNLTLRPANGSSTIQLSPSTPGPSTFVVDPNTPRVDNTGLFFNHGQIVAGEGGVLSLNNSPDTAGISLAGGNVTTSYTIYFPAIQGGAGTTLQNDGTGMLSWASASTTPGGASSDVQFNNGTGFAGTADFTTTGTGAVSLGDGVTSGHRGSLSLNADGNTGTNPGLLTIYASSTAVPGEVNFRDQVGHDQSAILGDIAGNLNISTDRNGTPKTFVAGADGGLGMPLLAAQPGSPAEGQIIYNSTTHSLQYWNGSTWVNVVAGGSKLINTAFATVTASQTATSAVFVPVGFSVTYAATNVLNTLLIQVAVNYDTLASTGEIQFDIFKDGASATGGAGIGTIFYPGSRAVSTFTFTLPLTPADTSVHTYDLYFNSANTGSTNVGNGTEIESMIIQEVTNP